MNLQSHIDREASVEQTITDGESLCSSAFVVFGIFA